MRDAPTTENLGRGDWNPFEHGRVVAGSAIILFIVVFWAALGRWPLSGATIEWVAGGILVSVVGLGIGTLATGAWIELKDDERSPFGRGYLAFTLVTLALLTGVQALFFWWLFDSQAGGSSRWIFWAFLASATASGAGGWHFVAPRRTALAKWVRTQDRWPRRSPDGGSLGRAFVPLAILTGMALGISAALGYVGGSAWAENSDVPQAPGMPAYSAGIQGSYVALGDSYSAGEGLRPFADGTNTPADDCHRAAGTAGDPSAGRNPAYPTLLESWLPAPDRRGFLFHACSGALIHEVLNPTNRDTLRIGAQYTGGRDPGVGLVTLTIGGNDASFAKIVQACLLSDQCMTATFPPAGSPGTPGNRVSPGPLLTTWAPQTIAEIGSQDFTLFGALRRDFPNARIIVLGYPDLFPADAAPGFPFFPPLCSALLNRFNVAQRDDLRKLQDELTNRTYEEAVAAGVEFLSPDASWGDHVPCGRQRQYTNSVKPFFSFPNPVDTGSFHPNAAGQRVYATLLACYLDQYPAPGRGAAGAPDPYSQGHPHHITIPAAGLVSPSALGLVDPPGEKTAPGGGFANC
jgi:hypothetical protein